MAAVAPRAPELVLRLARPGAEDLLAVPEDLDVVVLRLADLAPAQERRLAELRVGARSEEPLLRRRPRCHVHRPGRDVARPVDRSDDVRVGPTRRKAPVG